MCRTLFVDLEPCLLWDPLVKLLGHDDARIRTQAAWIIGTALQNNEKSQLAVCLFISRLVLIDSRLVYQDGRNGNYVWQVE